MFWLQIQTDSLLTRRSSDSVHTGSAAESHLLEANLDPSQSNMRTVPVVLSQTELIFAFCYYLDLLQAPGGQEQVQTTVSILQNAHLIHPFIFYSSILTPVTHCRHHSMWWAHCMTQLSNKHPIMLCGKFKLMSRPSWFWFQLSVVCCDDPVLMFWLRLGTVTTWVELWKIMCWL